MFVILLIRVNERANFWRKAAITDKKEPKPQSERDSEWRAEFQKNNLGEGRKISGQFWRGVEFKSQEKERTPELEKGLTNRDKMKKKQDAWEVGLILNTMPDNNVDTGEFKR